MMIDDGQIQKLILSILNFKNKIRSYTNIRDMRFFFFNIIKNESILVKLVGVNKTYFRTTEIEIP